MGLGIKEILIIGVALMVFFGPSKLPELGKSLGQGIREFKKAKDELMSGSGEAQAARK